MKSTFKKEMFTDSSQFQRVGVLSKSNLNLQPPRTAGLQSRGRFFESAKPEEFFRESEDSIASDDSAIEITKGKVPSPSKVTP